MFRRPILANKVFRRRLQFSGDHSGEENTTSTPTSTSTSTPSISSTKPTSTPSISSTKPDKRLSCYQINGEVQDNHHANAAGSNPNPNPNPFHHDFVRKELRVHSPPIPVYRRQYGEYTPEKLEELRSTTLPKPKEDEFWVHRSKFCRDVWNFKMHLDEVLQGGVDALKEYEEKMKKIHEKFALETFTRREEYIAEIIQIEEDLVEAMSVLGKGGTGVAADNAAQAASATTKVQSNVPVQLSTLGKAVNVQKHMAVVRRAEARRKDKDVSTRARYVQNSVAFLPVEGESTTDESDGQSTRYHESRDSLLGDAREAFEEKLGIELSSVKETFITWKRVYPLHYRAKRVSVLAPTYFSPYVRLELLEWEPLFAKTDIEDMQWHKILYDYGAPENGMEFSQKEAHLVNGLVEGIMLPILLQNIANCWDTLSTRETINAVFATNMLIKYVPTSRGALATAIHTRLDASVDSLHIPRWTPLEINAVLNAACILKYQFGRSVRLLRNIALWRHVIGLPIVEQLALKLLGKIIPFLQNYAADVHVTINRIERIMTSLDGVLAGPDATGDRRQKWQEWRKFSLSIVRPLEEQYARCKVEKEYARTKAGIETRALARRLYKVLVDLGEDHEARVLLLIFQLEEPVV